MLVRGNRNRLHPPPPSKKTLSSSPLYVNMFTWRWAGKLLEMTCRMLGSMGQGFRACQWAKELTVRHPSSHSQVNQKVCTFLALQSLFIHTHIGGPCCIILFPYCLDLILLLIVPIICHVILAHHLLCNLYTLPLALFLFIFYWKPPLPPKNTPQKKEKKTKEPTFWDQIKVIVQFALISSHVSSLLLFLFLGVWFDHWWWLLMHFFIWKDHCQLPLAVFFCANSRLSICLTDEA